MLCHCPEHGAERSSDGFPVGVVIPLRGPAGIFGPSCEAVTETALDHINASGGLLGRRVRPVVIDGGRPVREIAAQVGALVRSGEIHAVTGWHISQVRQHLVHVVRGHVPYVYTSLYEGGENSSGVFCSGETPPDQIAPAMRWMRDEQGTRDLFVVGDDAFRDMHTWKDCERVFELASIIVVDVVGAKPSGQASGLGGSTSVTSACSARSACW